MLLHTPSAGLSVLRRFTKVGEDIFHNVVPEDAGAQQIRDMVTRWQTQAVQAGYFAGDGDARSFADDVSFLLHNKWVSVGGLIERPGAKPDHNEHRVVINSDQADVAEAIATHTDHSVVRFSQSFFDAVEQGQEWQLRSATDGSIQKTVRARELWGTITESILQHGIAGVQFDTTINEWHTCPKSGRINGSATRGDYLFLDNTACSCATIDLAHFYDSKTMVFDVESFRHTVRLLTIVLDLSVAQNDSEFRPIGLGFTNVAAGVLMPAGIPYDSREARALVAAFTAIMTGEAYVTSAEMAKYCGAFPKFDLNRSDMLRVVRNHRRTAYNAPANEFEKLSARPVGIDSNMCPVYVLRAARTAWDRALELGEIYGFRNAHVTLLPSGPTEQFGDCTTNGIEPEQQLVKFVKHGDGRYVKVVHDSVPAALKTLKYSADQIDEIARYMRGTGSLSGAPHINLGALKLKGLSEEEIAQVELQIPSVIEIQFAFNVSTIGEATMQRLGLAQAHYQDGMAVLAALGFSAEQIQEANDFACGSLTIEGAPHVKPEHYVIFDCARTGGKSGKRAIEYTGGIRMMSAVQPFLSGAMEKTVVLSREASLTDVQQAITDAWKSGVKVMALHCDRGENIVEAVIVAVTPVVEVEAMVIAIEDPIPLEKTVASIMTEEIAEQIHAHTHIHMPEIAIEPQHEHKPAPVASHTQQDPHLHLYSAPMSNTHGLEFGMKRALPAKRKGMTIEARIGNQQVYLRTGEYSDGQLGEIFIDMYREGAAFRSVLNCFAIAVSMGLQHGVPLEKFVDKFTFTRFEPSGFTTHPNVKMCTSIVDYIFRVLAVEYLGRDDLAQVPPEKTGDRLDSALAHDEALRAGAVGEQTAILAMNAEAPLCDRCGNTTMRSAGVFKCSNCGATMGA